VNGNKVSFNSYNINDYNYFKLRDLALALSGTQKQFNVGWDADKNLIVLTSNMMYAKSPGETIDSTPATSNKTAVPSSQTIIKDGNNITLEAYNIDGYNYFKLRDIGQAFNFGVDWDAVGNNVVIDTSKGYTDNQNPVPQNQSMGYQNGNIGQGGLMAGDGNGLVYFRSESNGALYKAQLDGSNKQKISDDQPEYINVLDGWVYYANFKENYSLYRIRTDGTGRQLLKTGYCNDVYVTGNFIYYDIRDQNNVAQIYRMSTDGSGDALLIPNAAVKYVYNGFVYYSPWTTDIRGFWRYNLSTKENVQITTSDVYYPVVNDNGLYYWETGSSGTWIDQYHLVQNGQDRVLFKGGDHSNVKGTMVYTSVLPNPYDNFRTYNVVTGQQQVITNFNGELYNNQGQPITQDQVTDTNPAYTEGAVLVYLIQDQVYFRGTLAQSMSQKGYWTCLMRLVNGQMSVWD